MTETRKGNIEGTIFDIQRYSLHDGDGIRTLVFMKGCPLSCLWCSNPESQQFNIEIGSVQNCIRCGKCYEVCKQNAISRDNYKINKIICNDCLECGRVCPVKSKRMIGKAVTVAELMEIVEKDRIFYKNSSGGITVGGGEPSAQSKFVSEFLKKCKENYLNTSVETCGYATWDDFCETVQYADTIHFDIKHMNSEKHKKLTGVGNELILDNLTRIGKKKDVIIRVPVIPGLNDDENLYKTLDFASGIEKVVRVELLPFHTLGFGKYEWIGKENCLAEMKPYGEDQKSDLLARIQRIKGSIEIKIL